MDTVEKNIEGLAEQIISEDAERRAQELVRQTVPTNSHCQVTLSTHQDLHNIAPKRPNWDLKRDLEKKLARLERRTQEAIHTLISTWR